MKLFLFLTFIGFGLGVHAHAFPCDDILHQNSQPFKIPTYESVEVFIETKEADSMAFMSLNQGLDYTQLRQQTRESIIGQYSLTEVEYEQIEDYARYDFEDLNKVLRKRTEGNRNDLRKIEILQTALQKLPNFEGTSYRGLELSYGEFEKMNLKMGDLFSDPGFLSTDRDLKVAVKFSGMPEDGEIYYESVIFVVEGHSGKDISDISDHSYETEILFSPHSQFLIRSIKKHAQFYIVTLSEI